MFIVLVQVQVKLELLGEFKSAILNNAMRSVERDPGCFRFDVLQQEDDPAKWVFYEVYEHEDAWVQHRGSPHLFRRHVFASRDVGRDPVALLPNSSDSRQHVTESESQPHPACDLRCTVRIALVG